MSLRRSIETARFGAPGVRLAPAAVLLALVACASGAQRAARPPATEEAPMARHEAPGSSTAAGAAAAAESPRASGAAGSSGVGGRAASDASPATPPPARAVADFDRAVSVMKAGNAQEAELEFEQIAATYPRLAAPEIDLGILYRRAGDLDRSERALREAVARDAGSAVAWCELGVTLRMRGRFHDAEDAYEKAIAADPGFAPAYRNLGVLRDLYLGDAPGALEALERYQTLTGETEPVRGWIAEIKRRAGKRPAGNAPASAAAAAGNRGA